MARENGSLPIQPAHPLQDLPLGYRFEHDRRNIQFLLSARLPVAVPVPPSKFWFPPSPVLDQGAPNRWNVFNSCVGHGVYGALKTLPTWQRVLPPPQEIYLKAQDIDPWPGNADDGTSVLAGIKTMQSCWCSVAPSPHSHIREYLWEYENERAIRDWVKLRGPVILGTWWTTGMDAVDAHGMIHPTGTKRGGHCWFISGASDVRRAYRMQNSWGSSWGEKGRAWITYDDVQMLLNMGGEAAVLSDVVPVPSP